MKKIKATYAARGFMMNQVAGENELASLEPKLRDVSVTLNVVARDENVPEIERHIRTPKERCRETFNMLPFRRIPKRMMIELVYAMNFWLHSLRTFDGVSSTVSPRKLVPPVLLDGLLRRLHPMWGT